MPYYKINRMIWGLSKTYSLNDSQYKMTYVRKINDELAQTVRDSLVVLAYQRYSNNGKGVARNIFGNKASVYCSPYEGNTLAQVTQEGLLGVIHKNCFAA